MRQVWEGRRRNSRGRRLEKRTNDQYGKSGTQDDLGALFQTHHVSGTIYTFLLLILSPLNIMVTKGFVQTIKINILPNLF